MAKKKNSSKNKNMGKEEAKVFKNFYYMCKSDIDARKIADILKNDNSISVELWDEIGVIEVELGEKQSIDIVQMADQFGDDQDQEFLNTNGVQTVFSIETEHKNVDRMAQLFQNVVSECGGFVCSDSDDFMPKIVG